MSKRVHLPDGSIGEFPDSMSDQQIEGVLQKQFPKPSEPTTPQQPGFLKRFGQAVGVPTSRAEAEAMKPSKAEMIGGPAVTAGKLLYRYGKNIASELSPPPAEEEKAKKELKEHSLMGSADVGLKFLLRGPLAPIGGQAVDSFAEDVGKNNLTGAAGDALGAITNLLMLSKGGGATEKSVNKLSFAGGADPATVSRTLQDVRAAVDKPVQTVGDYRTAVDKAGKNIQSEFNDALTPIGGNEIWPSGVSSKIRSLITPDMEKTAEGLREKAHIEAAAKEFEKPWSYADLDSKRMRLVADLRNHAKKNPIARYTESKGNINTAIDDAISKSIRDIVYPTMDKAAGKPEGYFRDLKQRQGNLMELSSTLHDRVKALRTKSAQTKGSPRLSGEDVSVSMYPGSGVVPRMHGLRNILFRPDIEKAANRAAAAGVAGQSLPSKAMQAGGETLPLRYLMTMPEPEEDKKGVAAALQPVGAP